MDEATFVALVDRGSRKRAAKYGIVIEPDAIVVDSDFRYRDKRYHTLVVRPGVIRIHDHHKRRWRGRQTPDEVTSIPIADVVSVEAEWTAPTVWTVTIETVHGAVAYDAMPDIARAIREAIASQIPDRHSVAPEQDPS